ncbi:tripartite tricarboxylate transporter TctB family protein [Paracoccus sp. (in: a-proteobacteria)]|uniref:tripartite tricarboxylate transporter TctB family protein n=1 Tax=Paracoccus sp. TaxID=267 RepID=UPI0026E05745|nr:tripartite tricarboxylate transporter TctB family protein [Paracoccus sp. (in: a-proteobacteria)]MDO5371456.1 tripartite tricarboxylate transporter TctB family protein [Paracoccus sp. (in: a-proteobacteria)]
MTQPNRSDLAAGIVFIVIAAAFAWAALDVRMGTLLRMGPGYFPLVLSGLLAALGALMLLRGARQPPAPGGARPGPSFRVAWRPLLLVCGSALFFALTLGGLGLPLTTFATILIAASASQQIRPVESVLTAAAFAAGSWIVFAKLLGLPFRMFGTWIGG